MKEKEIDSQIRTHNYQQLPWLFGSNKNTLFYAF